MLKPRIVALIGIASGVAAIASRSIGPATAIQRPLVDRVVFSGDTVVFCAAVTTGTGRAAFAFVESSRAWIPGRLAACGPPPNVIPGEITALGPGLTAR